MKITPGSNPLEEVGRIADLAAEMRTAGLALDIHRLYAIFIDALPVECKVETRNLASRDSIGRKEIIKTVRERHHRFSGSRKQGSNSGHAPYAGERAGGGHGKGGGHGN